MSGDRAVALLGAPPRVVSLGLTLFADALVTLGVPVVQVDWQPPAGGDARLAELLARVADR